MINYSILSALGFKDNQIKRVESISENNETILFVELFPNQRTCPICSFSNCKIKEYKNKTIKSLSTVGTKTYIDYKLPRYICPKCNKTYTHDLSDTTFKSLSKKVLSSIIDDFSQVLTFTQIADKYNLSTTQIISIFDKYCPNLRNPIEEVICIDEFSNTRKSEDKYACLLVGFSSHKIIDIIKNRTLPYLRQYFSKQSLSQRDKVKFVITDMYDGYITIASEFFRNAIIAIDPFHYMKYFTDAVQCIRRKLCDSNEYIIDKSWMGKHWKLLTTNPNNLPKECVTLPSGETISYQDRIIRFVKQDKNLEYAYWLLTNFYITSKKLTYERAISFIDMVIKNMINSTSYELQECGKTWLHYQEYITNSFIKYNGVRLSNGPIEGVNSRIKTLKKICCGYRYKLRFYNRVILIVNKKGL